MTTKNFIALGLVFLVVVGAFYFAKGEETAVVSENAASKLCYIRNTEDGGSAELILNVGPSGTVTGDFFWKPSEKDSKTGPFEGVLAAGEGDTKMLIAKWNVYAEGERSVEELFIRLDAGVAAPGFGEMTLGEDGIYKYSNQNSIVYEPNLSLADCATEVTSQPVDSQFEPQRMTLTGTYTCLPHKNTEGPQTLECALGMKANDGKYYGLDFALMSQTPPAFGTGDRITVSGVFIPVERFSSDHYQKYNMEGVLSVTDSARKI